MEEKIYDKLDQEIKSKYEAKDLTAKEAVKAADTAATNSFFFMMVLLVGLYVICCTSRFGIEKNLLATSVENFFTAIQGRKVRSWTLGITNPSNSVRIRFRRKR